MKENFLCPSCKKPLEVTKQERLETLVEHVSNPNGTPSMKDCYQCVNPSCKACEQDVMWDLYGDLYGSDKGIVWIAGNNSPFGSTSRKSNVEINKVGVKDRSRFYFFGKYGFFLEHVYKADEDGNVLKHRVRVQGLKREGKGKSSAIHWTPGIVLLFKSVKHDLETLKRWRKDPQSGFCYGEAVKVFEDLPGWDKRWWRVNCKRVVRFLSKRTKRLLDNETEIRRLAKAQAEQRRRYAERGKDLGKDVGIL